MAYIYDKKSHWHACKREVLDNRLKKIVDDDYSDFFDYSSDFWLALCISYFTLSYEKVWESNDHSVHSILKCFFDKDLDVKVYDAVSKIADESGYDWDLLLQDEESFKKHFFDIRYQLTIPGVDNSGMLSEKWAQNIKDMVKAARNLNAKKEKITKNHIMHSAAKLDIGTSDKIKISTDANDYELPVEWLVSYVDALCSPKRFFLDERESSMFTSGEPVLDELGRIYNLYTSNMSLMDNYRKYNCDDMVKRLLKPGITSEEKDEIYNSIKEKLSDNPVLYDRIGDLVAAKDKLASGKENVIAALLSAANINMFALNYEDCFKTGLSPSFNGPLNAERDNLRLIYGNGGSIPGRMGFHKNGASAPGTYRNCVSHPGRLRVRFDNGIYRVIMQDRDNHNHPSGSFNTDLDTCIEFLEHPFFEKNMVTSIKSSDMDGVRDYELEAMFDNGSNQNSSVTNNVGVRK